MDDMEELMKALILASSQGNVEEVTKIIGGDVDVDQSLDKGVFCDVTALTTAAKHGHIECVRKIIELGGDLYIKGDFNGVRFVKINDGYLGAMVNAASEGYLECVQMIAELRFFPDGLDEKCPLYKKLITAAKINDNKLVQVLLNEVKDREIVLKGWKGHNVMNMGLLGGCDPSFLQLLIDSGIDTNGWDYNGLTPLMCAVLGGNLECVKFLISQEVVMNAPNLILTSYFEEDGTIRPVNNIWNQLGRTALMYAVCVGNISILKLLLDSEAKKGINRQEEKNGYSALLYASMSGNWEIVNLLLEHGADVNIHDFMKSAPICVAVQYDHADLFDLFLKRTTDLNLIYEAAEDSVCSHNTKYMSALVTSCDGKICRGEFAGRLMASAIRDGALECVQYLLQNGFSKIDDVSDQENTALIYSSRYGYDRLVEFCIQQGADLNFTDKSQMSAIMWAVQNNCVKCLELLMDAGADLDKVDFKDGTIFSYAMMGDGNCLEVLLKSGKMLHGKRLKILHNNAIEALNVPITFPLRNIILSMRYGVFEWDWCNRAQSLLQIAFAAVTLGISPGKYIKDNDEHISLLYLALMKDDVTTLCYLLVNLYFLPDDFRVLLSQRMIDRMIGLHEEVFPKFLSLIVHLSSQPLSLQSWSFLAISKALSCDVCLKNRAEKVDSLLLPEGLKRKLKFENVFSHLCSGYWEKIIYEMEANSNICSAVMGKKGFWKVPFVKCSTECEFCIGLGYTSNLWPVAEY